MADKFLSEGRLAVFPVLGWRNAILLFKKAVKVGTPGKTQIIDDFGDGFVCFGEKAGSFFDHEEFTVL